MKKSPDSQAPPHVSAVDRAVRRGSRLPDFGSFLFLLFFLFLFIGREEEDVEKE